MAAKNDSQDSVRDFLAESDKLIKVSERSLKQLDAMRQQLGLKAGASKQLLAAIPESEEKHQEAQQQLKSFLEENEINMVAAPEKKQKKKRDKLNKALRKNLRI